MGQSFSLDVSKWCKGCEDKLALIVKKVAFDLFTMIVRRSPVDTGRFRANNQISLNVLPKNTVLEFDAQDGNGAIAKGQGELSSFVLGDVIYIYNNVEYAVALEFGHSKQAPQGVYRISVEEMVAKIETALKGN